MELATLVVWVCVFVNIGLFVALIQQHMAVNERLREGLRQVDENMKLVNTMRAVEAGLLGGQATREVRTPCEDWLAATRN